MKPDEMRSPARYRSPYALDALLERPVNIRALVREDDDRAEAFRAKGVEIVIGDLLDIDNVRAAMEGVSAAYFVYPLMPGLVTATAYFAQAAQEAGVIAIVNMSQISARRDSQSHQARDHWVSERVFDWSGVGDGSGLRAVDTAVGRVGQLACWEHYNPLARYALMADGEEIHSAMYPGSFADDLFSEQISVNIRQTPTLSRMPRPAERPS